MGPTSYTFWVSENGVEPKTIRAKKGDTISFTALERASPKTVCVRGGNPAGLFGKTVLPVPTESDDLPTVKYDTNAQSETFYIVLCDGEVTPTKGTINVGSGGGEDS
ncbi:MAG: hypothetical protein MUF34_24305 [Polyangiaceae bacterium]|nr:hypothetical protein [Polyangiaceae bacterium]